MESRINLIFLLLLCCLIFSCKILYTKKFNLNQKFAFKSKEEYIKYLKAKKFNSDLFLYLDSASYISFITKIDNNTVYYNSFINDTLAIIKSDFLNDNQSCEGRIGKEIQELILNNTIIESKKVIDKNIYNNTLFYLKNNERYKSVDTNKKLTIFLVNIFETGTYYKSLYDEIEAVQVKHKKEINLFIISLSPVYALKN
jgi:hypothetical protein